MRTKKRTCLCGCGASLAGRRSNALYSSDQCKYRAKRATGFHRLRIRAKAYRRKRSRSAEALWVILARKVRR